MNARRAQSRWGRKRPQTPGSFGALSSACLAAVLAGAVPAAAQDAAAAEALFTRGLAEMDAGRYASGCPAIAESHRLDPRAGTIFTLAECEAKWGHVASAVTAYDDYLSLFARMTAAEQARQGERPRVAGAQRDALKPQVPELTLLLPQGAPRGTIVTRNGTVISSITLGIPLPVDPREHLITTQVPGGPVTEIRLVLARGEKKALMLPLTPPSLAPPFVAPPPPPAPAVQPPTQKRSFGLQVAGFVAAPIGGLAAVTGAALMYAKCGSDGSSRTPTSGCVGPALALGGGLVLLGGGIAAILVGGARVPVKPAQTTWVPEATVGLASGSLRWTF
jgi:hypothetical protein